MTAEIIVMNREAVVLAADSAVSTDVGTNMKISTSANKLFALSNKDPVGIMVYGNASFMGVPWETLIKYYRNHFSPKTGFPRLRDYAKNILEFLSYNNIPISSQSEEYYVTSFSRSLFQDFLKEIEKGMEALVESGGNINETEIRKIANDVINGALRSFKSCNKILRLSECSKILKKYRALIESIQEEIFHHIDMGNSLPSLLKQTLVYAFARYFIPDIFSGIVIAGFGHEDFIPKVVSIQVEGILKIQNKDGEQELLKYMFDDVSNDDDEYDNSRVLAFAQKDMVRRFMNGVDQHFLDASLSFLGKANNDFVEKIVKGLDKYNDNEKEDIKGHLFKYSSQLIETYEKNMDKFIYRYFTMPIIRAISRLPKKELAIMAEALVNLTSLKRKISEDPETVAEPIDVAVITKGDGFIWIKRKHYFEANFNPSFFINKLSSEYLNEKNN